MRQDQWYQGEDATPPRHLRPHDHGGRRRNWHKTIGVIVLVLFGCALALGACAVLLSAFGEADRTVTSVTVGGNRQATTSTHDHSQDGKVGDTATVVSTLDGGTGAIKLERVEGTDPIHLRLYVTGVEGKFNINPYDFYLRTSDDQRQTYDGMSRTPVLSMAELRKGKGVRGWLSFDAPRKGSVLVYAPGLGDRDLFEWRLS